MVSGIPSILGERIAERLHASQEQRECLYTAASLRASLPVVGIEYSHWHTKKHKQREHNLARSPLPKLG